MDKEERAVSWNVGPHGYQRNKEIHKIFEQGPPIICLQDVRIPKKRKNSVKRELQRVFPHYWIYITTAQSLKKDCRDRPYVYSVLTALHSAFFPKATQMRCPHSKQMDPDISREIRRPSLKHPGTDSYRDHISVYEYLPIHSRQSYGTNRHVDHDGGLDKQTKEQPKYNAR